MTDDTIAIVKLKILGRELNPGLAAEAIKAPDTGGKPCPKTGIPRSETGSLDGNGMVRGSF